MYFGVKNGVIKFPTKEDKRKKEMKDLVIKMIDQSEGDFCVIFSKEEMERLIEAKMNTEFLVVTPNIDFAEEVIDVAKVEFLPLNEYIE